MARPETANTEPAAQQSSRVRTLLLRFWREWLKPILVIVIVLSTFRSAVADWNDVPTGSMKPTIVEGDRIFVNKLAYDLKVPFTTWKIVAWSQPERGDIVVLFSPEDGTRLVKRVVGLPGDHIEVRGSRLFINDVAAQYEPLDDEIIAQLDADQRAGHRFYEEQIDGRAHAVMTTPARTNDARRGPFIVPEGHIFVMGDNRDNSRDSRVSEVGAIPIERVVGRATRVVISLDREHYYAPRWGRFFRALE
ncbi:MAG: signal peptidase I [Phycisphaerales bacterium]|nr:MAG: signal peptidase I [Phycisphaerales bacterium]